MRQHCEVCQSFRPDAVSEKKTLVELRYEGRTVVLCSGHARIAENSGVTSFDELRALYGSGRRSHLPRRSPTTQLRAGYERQGHGRRASDAG